MSVKVDDLDIKTSTTKARISSPELVTALIKDQGEALKLLKQISPKVSIGDVAVDKFGRIVITDKDFAAKISAKMKDAAALNIICGLSC